MDIGVGCCDWLTVVHSTQTIDHLPNPSSSVSKWEFPADDRIEEWGWLGWVGLGRGGMVANTPRMINFSLQMVLASPSPPLPSPAVSLHPPPPSPFPLPPFASLRLPAPPRAAPLSPCTCPRVAPLRSISVVRRHQHHYLVVTIRFRN